MYIYSSSRTRSGAKSFAGFILYRSIVLIALSRHHHESHDIYSRRNKTNFLQHAWSSPLHFHPSIWTRNFLLNLIFNLICSVVSFRDILPFSSLFFFSIPLTSCENYWQENNNWKVQRVKWNRVKSTKYSAVFNVFSNPFGTSDLFPRNERSMPENESNPPILTLNNLTILFFFFFFL